MPKKRSAITERGVHWQLVVFLVRYTPLRSVRARRGIRALQRAHARWRRERAERRGDDTYSRPAAHDLESRLHRYLPAPGFFVEAGAYDGYLESNTYYFERFCGWTGVLVEPIPELYRLAKKQRSRSRVVNCALVSPEQAGRPVRMRYAGTMSIVEGARGSQHADAAYLDSALLFRHDGYEVQAPGRTLTEVLDEVGAPRWTCFRSISRVSSRRPWRDLTWTATPRATSSSRFRTRSGCAPSRRDSRGTTVRRSACRQRTCYSPGWISAQIRQRDRRRQASAGPKALKSKNETPAVVARVSAVILIQRA